MFSFFRKKPPAAETSAPTETTRPRTAMEWLNADVGELLFGKKPAEASPPPSAPEPTPPAVAVNECVPSLSVAPTGIVSIASVWR